MKVMSSNEKEVNMKTRIILMGLGFVLLSFCGGEQQIIFLTPAIFAGITVIRIVEG